MRKKSEVWKAVEDQRPANVTDICWKRSYNGVKAALKHVGLELAMTCEEFDDIVIPLDSKRHKKYNYRKVIVTRAGHTSEPTMIGHLLTGNSGLLTDDERLIIKQRVGAARSVLQPKGVALHNNNESRAADELDMLIGATSFLHREHLWEHRLADVAYSFTGELTKAVWHGEQIKHAVADKRGVCQFKCAGNVAGMISYLKAGISLTCIGKSADDKVDVVWVFDGQDDIRLLEQFEPDQAFTPVLHMTQTSANKFTMAYNATKHRYDVGKSVDERKRLLDRKVSAARYGAKHTLTYLNEDDSQIPGETHRLEHEAFSLTRAACARIGVDVKRIPEDAYGPIDFRLGNIARNQDKVFRRQVCMRPVGRHPYNPDNIDIFQLTDLDKKHVYALPMRLIRDGKVESFFSETALMRFSLTCSAAWKEANKIYLYDLKDETGIQSYVNACIAASQVPQLTDRAWYSNILTANAQQFGSKKQMKARKAAAKAAKAEDTSRHPCMTFIKSNP